MVKGLSLFANVGIAETFLNDVGIDVVVANELLDERAAFYRHLYPSCDMVQGDIKDSDVYSSVISKSKEKNVEFIIATPPCQGMSYAGHKDPNDIRNSLITYVFDAINDLNPKYVLIENVVPQLKTPVTYAGKTMLIPDMIEFLFSNQYQINKSHVLNVETLGVPQCRKRALFLLVDKSLNRTWEIPKGDGSVVTLYDAIGDLPSLDPPIKEKGLTEKIFPEYEDKKRKGLAVSKWHVARQHVWRNVEVMMHTPTGKSAKDNPVYYPKNKDGKIVGGSCCAYKRMDWDKPAPTVTTYNHTISSFHNVHPGHLDPKTGLYTDARVLTVFELMRVTSLPDDWNIPEWASENLIRQVIGEGIPPLAIKKVVAELDIPREEH